MKRLFEKLLTFVWFDPSTGSPRQETIAEMLADCWHGRDWHRLSNREGMIFDHLQAKGLMRFKDGFIYKANTNALATPTRTKMETEPTTEKPTTAQTDGESGVVHPRMVRLLRLCSKRDELRKSLAFYVQTRNDENTQSLMDELKATDEEIRKLERY